MAKVAEVLGYFVLILIPILIFIGIMAFCTTFEDYMARVDVMHEDIVIIQKRLKALEEPEDASYQ